MSRSQPDTDLSRRWVPGAALVLAGAVIVWRGWRGHPAQPAVWPLWLSSATAFLAWVFLTTWQPMRLDGADPDSSSYQQGYALEHMRQPAHVPATLRRSLAEATSLSCAAYYAEWGSEIIDPRAPSNWNDFCAGQAQAQLDKALGRYHPTTEPVPFDAD